METYEKKYKEALERARKSHDKANDLIKKEWIETIFPELKESEDERIRKALLEMVHDTTGDELWTNYNVHKEEALAWLEKQDKQKRTDLETWKVYCRCCTDCKGGIGQYLDDHWTAGVVKETFKLV